MADPATTVRRALVLAVAPPLVYCAGMLYGLEGKLPRPGFWLFYVAFAGAVLALIVDRAPTRHAAVIAQTAEIVTRFGLALLLIQFALNKLIPGQFLLYNRDLDLPLRELPDRRLAWHFLGHSALYNGFVAVVELMAGLLLCSRRTVVAGILLSVAALLNVVVVDAAFGLRGALPIATVMASAALILAILHVDRDLVRDVVWRSSGVPAGSYSLARRVAWGICVAIVIGVPLFMNLGTRRGLSGQVAPAGRWEVLECVPNPGLAMCHAQPSDPRPVLYLEVGQWGQLVVGGERRNVSFSYDRGRNLLTARIAPAGAASDGTVVLTGTVADGDNTMTLRGQVEGIEPFEVHARRTHRAPWPPVRAY